MLPPARRPSSIEEEAELENYDLYPMRLLPLCPHPQPVLVLPQPLMGHENRTALKNIPSELLPGGPVG